MSVIATAQPAMELRFASREELLIRSVQRTHARPTCVTNVLNLPVPEDRVEKLDHAERWFRDAAAATEPPGAVVSIEVDMSAARALRNEMTASGSAGVTFVHILVKCVAVALSAKPDIHQLVSGSRRLRPSSVDVCLSISGESAITPVLIIQDAGNRSLEEIGAEIRGRADEARANDRKLRAALRSWGWLVPFSILRRGVMRALFRRLQFRRRISGTVQLTVIPTVDVVIPLLINTTAALAAGRVRDRVIAVNGRAEVRPTIILTCAFDHNVWNGEDASRFVNAVRTELENPIATPATMATRAGG